MTVSLDAALRKVRTTIATMTRGQRIWTLIMAVALLWPLTSSSYNLFLATTAAVAAILLISVGITAGDAGMASLCQLSFAAVSAWVFSQFVADGSPLPWVLEVAVSCAAAGALGAAVGLPALRLRSVNLAVVTLGVASAVDVFLNAQGFPTSAAAKTIPRPPWVTGDRSFYVFCLACFLACAVLLRELRRRRSGASWQSVRHSERATAAMGISVVRTKISVFVISATIAGLSGTLLAAQLGSISESNFPATQSLVIFAVAVFVGTWRWQGALFAGVMSVAVPELFRRAGVPQDYSNVLFAVGAAQALASGTSVADGLWPRHVRSAPLDTGSAAAWQRLVSEAADAGHPGTDRPPALRVSGLKVSYGGVRALDGVDLVVPAASIVSLIGANGAGKSTLIDAVSGFTASIGEITVAGRPLAGSPRARARAGVRRTFQQDRVVPSLTVGQYLSLGAGRDLTADEVSALVAFAGLQSPSALVGPLEGASRRLLEVASALAARPAVVLLDEPVAGLSGAEALAFAAKLRDAPAVFGCAVVVIEHDVDFVRELGSVVVALDFGKVIATGSVDGVLGDPAVRTAYLGDADLVA